VNRKRAAVEIRTNQDFVRKLPQVAAYERAEISALTKLAPPASMSSDWTEILAGNRTIAENTAKVAEDMKVNNVRGAHALLVASTQAQLQMSATAEHDGFKDCARLS
jgi:copper homeostasis protein CutC